MAKLSPSISIQSTTSSHSEAWFTGWYQSLLRSFWVLGNLFHFKCCLTFFLCFPAKLTEDEGNVLVLPIIPPVKRIGKRLHPLDQQLRLSPVHIRNASLNEAKCHCPQLKFLG